MTRPSGAHLSPDEIVAIAREGAELGCLEALFTLGDRPEDRWPEARAWLDEQGYDSTIAYIRAMAIRASVIAWAILMFFGLLAAAAPASAQDVGLPLGMAFAGHASAQEVV